MIQHKSYEINSTNDIELNIKRDSKLEFKVSFDDEKAMKALFVFIEGCGTDIYASYNEHIAEFVVKEFACAVLRVNYHCIQNRPQLGAKTYFDNIDLTILNSTCESLGISLPIKLTPQLNQNIEEQEFVGLARYIDDKLESLQNEWKFDVSKKLTFTYSLQPTKNEYQNFGLMQALDILNALCFVRKNYAEFKLAKTPKTLLFGYSHGAYLALLCAKFAPWLIDGVVESSAYVTVPLSYIGFGKEIDYEKYGDLFNKLAKTIFVGYSKSLWTSNKNSPHFFSPAHNRIRNILDEKHLQIYASHHKAKIISYHCINDTQCAPVSQKEAFHNTLKKLGFDSTLHIATQKDIDGKFIKNVNGHGMDMSIKMLIQKELPPLLARDFKHEKNEKREISYPSENLEYHFKEAARGGGIDLMIKRLDDE